ncbi:MAG: TIR domain-containing protein [Bacteroidota bacterium]
MPPPPKYNAFISYSRKDEAAAKRLEYFLEHYKIPKDFQSLNQKRFSIFRDIHDIELGDLSEKLREGLDRSDFLIVLCSPDSYRSKYVGQEIKYFGERKGKDKILPVLLRGRPTHRVKEDDPIQDPAFHKALYHFFDNPLAAEFRRFSGEGYFKRQERIREARFQIISRLLYTSKTSELVGRYLLAKRFRAGILGLIFLIGVLFLSWKYYDAIPKAGISFAAQSSSQEERARTNANLDVLNAKFKEQLPRKSNKDHLLVATWNIKDFDQRSSQALTGNRNEESLAYIAEIISHFDIVAIQEVKEDLRPLEIVMDFLGNHWEKKFTGISEGRSGNKERLGFIFDTRKIKLGDLTDEIVLSEGIPIDDSRTAQISRTPYLVEFIFNNAKIHFCNVHIHFGGSSGARLQRRLDEIETTTKVLKRKIDESTSMSHLVLLGDMNVVSPNHETMKIIKESGFFIPDTSINQPTNMSQNKYYDQIAFTTRMDSFDFNILSGGSLNFYEHVYREEDQLMYEPIFRRLYREGREPKTDGEVSKYYRRWKSGQMSDHLVKWVEISL